MEAAFYHQLETKIVEWMATAVAPGLSIAVLENSELVWHSEFGTANVETKEPVSETTIFQAASLSKPLFAYAVLQLVENGRLDLDKPLLQYLPANYQPEESNIANEPTLSQITTRQVLSHQTGFPNWPGDAPLLQNHFIPGTRFGYSGAAFHFLQEVVEHLTTQAPEAWMQENVLQPLCMSHSSFINTPANGRHLARGHDKEGNLGDFWEIPEMGAAYSLHTTAVDFAQFIAHCCQPSATLQTMLTPQIQVNDSTSSQEGWPDLTAYEDPRVSWGLGWGLQETANGRAFWHWGDNGTYKAFAIGYPANGTGMVMFSNSQNGGQLWRPLLNELFGSDQPCLDWLERAYG